MFLITKESELHHSIGSPIDGAHPGPKTDRDYRPFQRSTDSNGPDNLYRSSDLAGPKQLLFAQFTYLWNRIQHLEIAKVTFG